MSAKVAIVTVGTVSTVVIVGVLAQKGVLTDCWRNVSSKVKDAADRLRKKDGSQAVEVLKGNHRFFSKKDQALIATLLELGQDHLFTTWPAPGRSDNHKRRLVRQLAKLDASYPGGLRVYITNAKKLLVDSRDGVNPFAGYTPSVPQGEKLDFGSEKFMELEDVGAKEAGSAAFVLVAGGLGERLGFSGIKVALPCESATGTTFLQLYCSYIKALQDRWAPPGRRLPFAIMTSDDTHARTLALLLQHKYFGLDKRQVTLIKQEKVACLADNDARLAVEPGDAFSVQTKPHGHGDVHALLYSSGLVKQWRDHGIKWVCFFQDTNALVTKALAAALGASAVHDYDVNSLAVPRKAKEAIGAITCLSKAHGGGSMTINVEYNQLDPLLRSTISKAGDVNDATGFSPFPGNINQIVIKLASYLPVLEHTRGVISEFVNPKYKDAGKTEFKSSTRLECMMQDYPKSLPPTAKVGFTVINQVWASYSPVKNSVADAQAKAHEGNPTHSATAGELDMYKAASLQLAQVCQADVGKPKHARFNGMEVECYPRVVLAPSFAPTLSECKSKIAPNSITLAPGAVLVVEGAGVRIEGPLHVDGALFIRAARNAKVTIRDVTVRNAGWQWLQLPDGQDAPEELRIRGFKVVRKETRELVFTQPGVYTISDSNNVGAHQQQQQQQHSSDETVVEPAEPTPITAAASAAVPAPARSGDAAPLLSKAQDKAQEVAQGAAAGAKAVAAAGAEAVASASRAVQGATDSAAVKPAAAPPPAASKPAPTAQPASKTPSAAAAAAGPASVTNEAEKAPASTFAQVAKGAAAAPPSVPAPQSADVDPAVAKMVQSLFSSLQAA